MCIGHTLQVLIIIVPKIEDELLDFITENHIRLQINFCSNSTQTQYFPDCARRIYPIDHHKSQLTVTARMRFRTSYHPYLVTHGPKQVVCISRVFHFISLHQPSIIQTIMGFTSHN